MYQVTTMDGDSSEATSQPTSLSSRAARFESAYAGTPPWDIGRPQPAFQRLAERGDFHGRVLDIGCGTGEHALLAASLGLVATGIDAAPTPIERARRKAKERRLDVRFLHWNALALPQLGEQFDTVLDCGLFHVFDDAERACYVESLSAAVVRGGRYYMLCFSDRQPGDWGPRRVRQEEIRQSFADGWEVLSIEESRFKDVGGNDHAIGWLATSVRT